MPLQVIFSDEVGIQLPGGQRASWTKGPRGVRTVRQFSPKIQFWAALGYGGSSSLVRVDRVNAQRYTETLRHHLLPLTRHRPNLLFQQDNAPAHTSRTTRAFLAKKLPGRVIEWPALSPDLSPIENGWSELKRRINLRSPKTVIDLERVAKQEWSGLSGERPYLDSLFFSMERRLQAVVDGKGNFLPY